MGETKKTQQDELQKPGLTSEGKKGNTSEKTEPQTYSQEQLDEAVSKGKSDALAAKSDELAAAGRTDKQLTARETTVKAREDAIKVEQERRDAAELVEAQKDPDKLAAYQAQQVERQRVKGLDEREANLVRDKADHEAEITAAKETQREIVIFEIATAKGVDPVRLKDLSTKFNIEGKENLEELATEIASGKPKPGDKDLVEYGKIVEDFGSNSAEAKLWRQEHPDFEADNALTKGGSGEKSAEQRLKDRYPTM